MSEWLWEVFGYDPSRPLFYTQLLFWAFFTVLLALYTQVHQRLRLRSLYLALASLFLYYKAGGYFFTLLIFSTVTDYYLGHAIHRASSLGRRKLFLAASVTINLTLLGYFKYTFFLVNMFNRVTGAGVEPVDYLGLISNQVFGTGFDISAIFLPVGISFYTFQTISYTADVYRGKTRPVDSIVDFGFYVSFFPQLVAGPIVRAAEFVPQIAKRYRVDAREMGLAFFLIANGMVKKILISDYISINYVDRVFAEPAKYSGFENLMAVYGYAIQIYCDFSGYTDIAIGLALLLGFRLPVNFNSPYKALNITDFWRRWHISLSTWLRDYLYIPLGGNRKGRLRTYIHLMITMLLGGLWHGANLKFVFWGGLHGLGLAFHKGWMHLRDRSIKGLPVRLGSLELPPPPFPERSSFLTRLAAAAVTFHFVCLCWIFFRAESFDLAGTMIYNILFRPRLDLAFDVLISYWKVFAIMGFGYLMHWAPVAWKSHGRNLFISLPDPAKAVLLGLTFLALYQVKSAAIQPFIYFQF